MSIRIEYKETHDAQGSTYNVVDCLLRTVSELTMPIDVVNTLIGAMKDTIVRTAANVGNSACDLIEGIDDLNKVTQYLNAQRLGHSILDHQVKCLVTLENYQKAAVAAGANKHGS